MVSKDTPKDVLDRFKTFYSYNPLTGNISSDKKKSYDTINRKGYRGILSQSKNYIEYVIVYHRLVWFLYYGEILTNKQQIDHIDNDKLNNRIINLRVVTNAQNAYKRGLNRKNNSTGFKGVAVLNEKGSKNKFIASIAVDKRKIKIGRFKSKIVAAKFYDAANRFYYGEFALPNFETVFIKPQNVKNLRDMKKTMVAPSEMEEIKKLDKLLEVLKD